MVSRDMALVIEEARCPSTLEKVKKRWSKMSFTRAEKSANVVEAFPRILTVRNIANPQHLIRIKSVRAARGACGGGAVVVAGI